MTYNLRGQSLPSLLVYLFSGIHKLYGSGKTASGKAFLEGVPATPAMAGLDRFCILFQYVINARFFSALTGRRGVGHVEGTQVPQGLTGNPVQSGSGPAAVNHVDLFPSSASLARCQGWEDREQGDEPEDLLASSLGHPPGNGHLPRGEAGVQPAVRTGGRYVRS